MKRQGTQMTADEVLARWSLQARSTIEGIVNVTNGRMTITDFDKLSSDQLACIKSVRQTTTEHGGSLVVEMHDPHGPLTNLAKYLGMRDTKSPGKGA